MNWKDAVLEVLVTLLAWAVWTIIGVVFLLVTGVLIALLAPYLIYEQYQINRRRSARLRSPRRYSRSAD